MSEGISRKGGRIPKIVKTVDRRTLRRGAVVTKNGKTTGAKQQFAADVIERVWWLYLNEVALGYLASDVGRFRRVAEKAGVEIRNVRHIILYYKPWKADKV